jgi:hypothetical protein
MLKGSGFNTAPTFTGLSLTRTDISGTPGNGTVNTPRGSCAIAIGAAAVTISSSIVTANSTILCSLQFADATLTQLLRVVPGASTFTITGNAVATAATRVDFVVIN